MDSEFIKKMVRAVVQSKKEGVPIDRLHSEYRALCGESIPLARLGYSRLEDFLWDMPSVVRLERCKGELRCFAVASEDTHHIAELVARQKSSSKSGPSQLVNCKMRFKPCNLYAKTVRPTPSLRQPRPGDTSRCASRFPTASRGCSASGDYRQFDQKLKAVTPLHHRQPASQLSRKPATVPDGKENLENAKKPKEVPSHRVSRPATSQYDVAAVQSRMTQLLQRHSSGVWLSKLPDVYRGMFGQTLLPQAVADMDSWTHICSVEEHSNTKRTDKLLYPPLPAVPSPRPRPRRTPPVSPLGLGSVTITPPSSPPSPERHAFGSKLILAKPTFIFPKVTAPSPVLRPQPSPSVPQRHEENNNLRSRVVAPPTPPGPAHAPGPVPGEVRRGIEDLLSRYSMGLWAHALPKLFMETYKTPFPDHVLNNLSLLLDFCCVEYPSPHDKKKAILYKLEQPDVEQNCSCLLPSGLEVVAPAAPPRLVRPAEHFPSVLVTEAKSSNAVTVRYVGENYSNAQEAMEDTMALFYSRRSPANFLSSLTVGQLVAVRGAEEEEELARAQVMEILDPEKVKVYYVDYGFSVEASRSSLLKLHPDFTSLPFQAINVTLAGLEAFSSDPLLLSCLETLAVEKILLMETMEASEQSKAAVVLLYDTSQEDDLNINSSCLKALQDSSMHNPLQVGNTYRDVSVTNVCADGVIYCQLPSRGMARLNNLLEGTEDFFTSQMTSDCLVSKPFTGKMCLARYRGQWARVEIINLFGNRVVEIFFVDFGIPATVEITDLREIPPSFLRRLIVIPPQAVQCFLAELTVPEGDWSPETVQQVKEAVQSCNDCRMQVVKLEPHKEDKLVHMYLFVGVEGQELSDSVNHQLVGLVMKHNGVNGTEAGSSSLSSSLNPEQSADTLHDGEAPSLLMPPPLELPQPGCNMDVMVPVACHPGYFVVQRLEDLYRLTVLTEELMLYYDQEGRSSAAVPLERGDVYAAKINRSWRRVQVKGLLSNGLVSVYELDHGRHELVRRTVIQPLVDDFRQLPFLAIAARLAGVDQERWAEESSMLFRNHVEGRALVAQVESVQEASEGHGVPWERRLTVYLVDTSAQNDDLWIHSVMADVKQ